MLEESISAASSSLLGNLAISVVAATVAGILAWLLGLPFAIVPAVITWLLDLIPQVGATIAILAVPFAAVIKIVMREAGRPRRERMEGLRETRERVAV